MCSPVAALDSVKRDLVLELLRRSGSVRVRVEGISMLPALWPGDIITVAAHLGRRLTIGEIAFFHREGRFITHRVVSVHADGLITRGDSNARADAFLAFTDVLGRVMSVDRNGGLAPADKLPHPFACCLAFLLRHCPVLRGVAVRLHRLLARNL